MRRFATIILAVALFPVVAFGQQMPRARQILARTNNFTQLGVGYSSPSNDAAGTVQWALDWIDDNAVISNTVDSIVGNAADASSNYTDSVTDTLSNWILTNTPTFEAAITSVVAGANMEVARTGAISYLSMPRKFIGFAAMLTNFSALGQSVNTTVPYDTVGLVYADTDSRWSANAYTPARTGMWVFTIQVGISNLSDQAVLSTDLWQVKDDGVVTNNWTEKRRQSIDDVKCFAGLTTMCVVEKTNEVFSHTAYQEDAASTMCFDSTWFLAEWLGGIE